MKNIKTYIWLHVKLKCSQIMNLTTLTSRQRAPKSENVPTLAPSSGCNYSAILVIYGSIGRPLVYAKKCCVACL